MISIGILTCWYGPYPWYLPYFVHSCKYNSTIDFIIITDNKEHIPNKPENVKIIQRTIEEIKIAASQKLGFAVNIEYAYKLNDFKPVYGYLFPEIIEGYDFWGHGDIDLVYGNIRDFMTGEVLNNYDVINSRHDYVAGHFCLFKNNERVNKLFTQSRDYKHVLSNSEYYCFDECSFLHSELHRNESIFDYPSHIQSMTWVIQKAALEGKLRVFFDFMIIEGTPGNIVWENGKIIYKNEYEALYYHLIKFKKVCEDPKWAEPFPDSFYFTPNKIVAVNASQAPDASDIDHYKYSD